MAFKLDDFLTKKKEPTQVLDLSKVKIATQEEFKKYLDKVPEFKIKPEKIIVENIKIRDKDFSFVPGKREEKQAKEWSFPDPTPPDMRGVKLEDLCPVNIDWKMLTTLRPKTKVEEEMFSRLVQLGKLDLKYRQSLLREKSTEWIRKSKNPRSSIVEVRVLSCKDCGEDFCDGTLCSKLTYDHFSRAQPSTSSDVIKGLQTPESGKVTKKNKKKQSKGRRKKRSSRNVVKPRKNSIFNRPPTKGCSRDHSRRGSHGKVEKMRSSSLSRIQSEKKPSFLKLKRSKSAPRFEFKRKSPDRKFAYPRSQYASDSGPTQTDYSSQSDSEGYPALNRISSPASIHRKHSSGRVEFNDGYQSDSGAYPSRKIGYRYGSLPTNYMDNDASGIDSYESNESLAESCGVSRSSSHSRFPVKSSRPSSKYPTTIQIKFDGFYPKSTVFFPRKSYPANKTINSSVHLNIHSSYGALRNQEVTKVMEGFARIDLSFTDEEAIMSTGQRTCGKLKKVQAESVSTSPKRVSSKRSKLRPKSGKDPLPCYLKGQGLLGKFLNRKN